MLTLIDNEYAALVVYPEKGIVHHTFHKSITGQDFQDVFLKGAEAFEKYKCTKWLSDDRNSAALKHSDITWAQEYWEPKILKVGWKYWALLMTESAVGQMSMKRIVERYMDMRVEVKLFIDADAAMEWLENQE